MRGWATLVVALVLTLLSGLAPAPTATASASTFIYDAPATAHVDAQAFSSATASRTQLREMREASASPSAEARGTSTTSTDSFIATEGAERTVVIGRSMPDRVTPYADANGFDVYKGTPKWVPFRSEKVDLWFNNRWISGEMRAGSRIVDIGELAGFRPSKFYNMESEAVDGYWNYVEDFQP